MISNFSRASANFKYQKLVNLPDFSININTLPINIAIYEIKDGEVCFVDLNLAAQLKENVNKNDIIGKKLLDVFPGAKAFGLYDLVWEIFKKRVLYNKPESHFLMNG